MMTMHARIAIQPQGRPSSPASRRSCTTGMHIDHATIEIEGDDCAGGECG
jgi:hypothetical protein